MKTHAHPAGGRIVGLYVHCPLCSMIHSEIRKIVSTTSKQPDLGVQCSPFSGSKRKFVIRTSLMRIDDNGCNSVLGSFPNPLTVGRNLRSR